MLRTAGLISLATLFSRILGVVRDVTLAMLLGAGVSSDAFYIAFRIPDLFRKLFGEGALSFSFIPVFTKLMSVDGKDAAFTMARTIFFWLMMFSIIPVLMYLIGEGTGISFFSIFYDETPVDKLVFALSRIMFPYTGCILFMAVCVGILNSLEHFAAPALAPVLFNLVMIFSAFFVVPHLSHLNHPAVILAWTVTIGGGIQLLIFLPILVKKGFQCFGRFQLIHPEAVNVAKLGLPALSGLAGYQVNLFVCTFLAAFLSEGTVSYLYYADRLVQFPLALITVSLSTPLFPELAKKVAVGDVQHASSLFTQGGRLVLFITIPAMVGLLILREQIVALLFYQGAFGLRDVHNTGVILMFFCVGLWAFSGVRFYVPLYYALSDMKTPLQATLAAVMFNLILSNVLMKIMGASGLPLSISLASALNFFILHRGLWMHRIYFRWKEVGETLLKSSLLSILMVFMVYPLSQMLCPPEIFMEKGRMGIGVLLSVLLGGVVYLGLAFSFKTEEVKILIAGVLKD